MTLSRQMKRIVIGYWIATALFCLQMGFTAYAQLSLPQVADAFRHLGFPAYFRVENSWAKLLGIVVLLGPLPPRIKEWAYAGFFFDLTGAAATRAFAGDGAADIVAPLVFLALVMASRALAPARRKISVETVNPAEVVFV